VEQATELVKEGALALERNDLATAQSLFQKAVEINPRDAEAHAYLGVLADRAGDLQQAARHFAAAATADPTSAAAKNNYGAVLLKLGKPEPAAEQFEASLKLNRNQPSALINLGQIRFASGSDAHLKSARELFERAFALAPDVEIARALVVVALRLKDRDAASKYFRDYTAQLASSGDRTITAASRAELGTALSEANLFAEAIMELNAAVGMDQQNSDAVVSLARAYVALDDLRLAGRTLESAVARGLETAPIYALLASVYEKSGHIENAIPAMRLAIQRDPHSEIYRFTYGMLLTSVLAPEAAVIRLKEALNLFPNSARLWLALGIAHFKAGRNDEAQQTLQRAIKLDPKFAPAYAYLGMTYVEIGHYEEAVKSYQQALVVNEKLGVVDYLIADALLRQPARDDSRIEVHLLRAVKLEPSFPPARLALGKLYARTNRLNEAATELESVIKSDANLAEAYYQLGRVYVRQKRTAEAQPILATFKRLSDSQKEQEQKDRKDIVRRLGKVLF
jgi:Tfp pilus assembly protein PilF